MRGRLGGYHSIGMELPVVWVRGLVVFPLVVGCPPVAPPGVIDTSPPAPLSFDSARGWGSCAVFDSGWGIVGGGPWINGTLPHPDGGLLVGIGSNGQYRLDGVEQGLAFDPATLVAHRTEEGWNTPYPPLAQLEARPLHAYDDGSVLVLGVLGRRDPLEIGDLVYDGTSSVYGALVLLRLEPDGTARWGRVWPDTFLTDARHGVALADGSAVVAVAMFEDTRLDPGGEHEIAVTLPDRGVGYGLIRVGADGEIQWVRAGSGGHDLVIADLSYDAASDTLAIAGKVGGGETTFDLGRPDALVHDPTGLQLFVAGYDSTGRRHWLVHSNGGDAWASAVQALPDGSVLAGGDTGGLLQFSEAAIPSLISSGGPAAWIARFDAAGVARWGRASAGVAPTARVQTTAVAADPEGGVYWVGTLWGDVAFGSPPAVAWSVPPSQSESFVVRVDPAGAVSCGLLLATTSGRSVGVREIRALGGGRLQLAGWAKGDLGVGVDSLSLSDDVAEGFVATIRF